jgi:hypothetical protein
MTPVDVVKGPSMKVVLVFDWSSFRLNHAAMNVESHLISLGSVSEWCGSVAGQVSRSIKTRETNCLSLVRDRREK